MILSLHISMIEEKEEKGSGDMLPEENVDVEYKEIYTDEIKEEVIAFANTEGGTIYIGVRDDGKVVGLKEEDAVMLAVSSSINDSIQPNISPYVQIRLITLEGKHVIRIDVSVGAERPYYVGKKGLKPSGVYVRRGSAKIPLSEEGIRRMIADSYGGSFEGRRSVRQDLTFKALKEECALRNIDISTDVKKKNLKLLGDDDLYTNLALLLSDQCPYSGKVAVFHGKTKEDFQDRKEFTGSILTQLSDISNFLDLLNRTHAVFHGLRREDRRDYPEVAIREALLNAAVHRDYSLGGSNIINLYQNRMEIISLGGLVDGLSMEAIFLGASLSRNPNLAALFYRMKLIESYGTGIPKIEEQYKNEKHKPEFTAVTGAFRVVLYNKNEEISEENEGEPKEKIGAESQREERMILAKIESNGQVTRKQVENLLNIGQTKAYRILTEMTGKGTLRVEKAGKNTIYRKA